MHDGVRVRDDLAVLDLAAGAGEEQVLELALDLLLDRALALFDTAHGGLGELGVLRQAVLRPEISWTMNKTTATTSKT